MIYKVAEFFASRKYDVLHNSYNLPMPNDRLEFNKKKQYLLSDKLTN